MVFRLGHAIQVLERTPSTLRELLSGLSDDWLRATEGEGTWSPYDVVGHLIHGEMTDWIARLEIILSDKTERRFETFDRSAQFQGDQNRPIAALLAEFADLRRRNLDILRAKQLSPADMNRTATHPQLGTVTLSQLLATWVAHDLDHIAQIARVMGKQYRSEVGPWVEYLRIVREK